MKYFKVANSKNDEFYTPRYAVQPIIKYLKAKKYKRIWCPFDTKDSWFVKLLNENNFNVIFSHIDTGQNFFLIDIPDCDCIVSNPPYSIKGDVLDYLFKLKKPFAMLVSLLGLFESEKRFTMFESNIFEILYLNKRIAYFKNYEDQKPMASPPFTSAYLCSNLLPKQICFERINNKEY